MDTLLEPKYLSYLGASGIQKELAHDDCLYQVESIIISKGVPQDGSTVLLKFHHAFTKILWQIQYILLQHSEGTSDEERNLFLCVLG